MVNDVGEKPSPRISTVYVLVVALSDFISTDADVVAFAGSVTVVASVVGSVTSILLVVQPAPTSEIAAKVKASFFQFLGIGDWLIRIQSYFSTLAFFNQRPNFT